MPLYPSYENFYSIRAQFKYSTGGHKLQYNFLFLYTNRAGVAPHIFAAQRQPCYFHPLLRRQNCRLAQ